MISCIKAVIVIVQLCQAGDTCLYVNIIVLKEKLTLSVTPAMRIYDQIRNVRLKSFSYSIVYLMDTNNKTNGK